MRARYLTEAIEAGFDAIFSEEERDSVRYKRAKTKFLRAFDIKLKDKFVDQVDEELGKNTRLQEGIIRPLPGNTIHTHGVGNITIERLSFSNWVRALFKKPLRNIHVTTSVQEIKFEERVIN